MNLEQAVAMTRMQKQIAAFNFEEQEQRSAKQIAELVFELSAAAGEP